MNRIVVFPGQGSQFVGMGKDLFEKSETARRLFKEADEALGFSISAICFEGPEEELVLTKHTQPAILTVSYILWKLYEERYGTDDILFMAGHSLGEYTALVAAGALSFADAVRAVYKRGLFMQEAVPVGKGAMAALIDIPRERVEELCAASDPAVRPANFNSPRQIVISGDALGVDAVVSALKSEKKRAMKLNVSAPFHSPLMAPAQDRMKREVLSVLQVSKPLFSVIANVTARPYESAEAVPLLLAEQITGTVKWEDSIRFAVEQGVSSQIEIGPGKVLTKLAKQIAPELKTEQISSFDAIYP